MLSHLDDNHRRLAIAVSLVVLVFTIGTVGYRLLSPGIDDGSGNLEPVSWHRCVYMTVISLTTVGYGETVPVEGHPHMMVFTTLLLLGGIGVLTYSFGAFTAFLLEGTLNDVFWRRKMTRKLNDLDEHFIVCGAGETSHTAIRELHRTKRDFVVVDVNDEVLKEAAREFDICVVAGDATDDETLKAAGIDRARGLLASLPTDKDNLFLVVTARQLNDRMRIVSKVTDPVNNEKFLKAGADDLASPQVIGGLRLVSQLIRPSVVTFLDLMLREKDKAMRIEEVQMGAESEHVGRNLRELALRQKFKVQVLAVQPKGLEKFNYTPDPDEPIAEDTTLVILGEAQQVGRLREELCSR